MKQQLLIPGLIVLGGILIAFGVYWGGNSSNIENIAYAAERDEYQNVYGDKDAEIIIVEFSDFECPYCAGLHPTLETLVEESNGEISWEFRHLPIPTHRNAFSAAVATECVAELQDNDAFWAYAKSLFENQRSISTSFLETEATKLGITADDFSSCIEREDIKTRVNTDIDTAVSLGGNVTPFSVVIFPDGHMQPIRGALSLTKWRSLINQYYEKK